MHIKLETKRDLQVRRINPVIFAFVGLILIAATVFGGGYYLFTLENTPVDPSDTSVSIIEISEGVFLDIPDYDQMQIDQVLSTLADNLKQDLESIDPQSDFPDIDAQLEFELLVQE